MFKYNDDRHIRYRRAINKGNKTRYSAQNTKLLLNYYTPYQQKIRGITFYIQLAKIQEPQSCETNSTSL